MTGLRSCAWGSTRRTHPPRGQFFATVHRAQSAIFARKEWSYLWLGPVARSYRKSGGTALGSRQPPFRQKPIYSWASDPTLCRSRRQPKSGGFMLSPTRSRISTCPSRITSSLACSARCSSL